MMATLTTQNVVSSHTTCGSITNGMRYWSVRHAFTECSFEKRTCESVHLGMLYHIAVCMDDENDDVVDSDEVGRGYGHRADVDE